MRHLARAALLALCLAAPLGTASADDTWEKIVPTLDRGEITALEALPGGDLLVAGSASVSDRSVTSGWIARFKPEGEQVWSREFIGEAYSVLSHIYAEGDRIYVGGTHISKMVFEDDMTSFVAVLSLDGEFFWETTLSNPGHSISLPKFIISGNGDFLVRMTKSVTGKGGDRAFYARLSPDGTIKWTYDGIHTGQYYEDLPPLRSLVRDPNNAEIHNESPGPIVETDDGSLQLYINRVEMITGVSEIGRCEVVSADGDALEDQECPHPEQAELTIRNRVAPYAVMRLEPGFVFANEISVEKPAENGSPGWKWSYESEHRAGLTDAVLTPDGGLIGVGYSMPKDAGKMHGYDAVIFRLAPDGTELWSQEYASPTRDIFARIVALGEDRYAVAGHTGVNSSTGQWDPWLLILDGDGTTQSAVPQK